MAYLKAELSEKNQYWIPRHRYYELKHYCLQYPEWKHAYSDLGVKLVPGCMEWIRSSSPSDPTARIGQLRADLRRAMDLVERTALDADPVLGSFIFKGVTEGIPYAQLSAREGIPCGKDLYYECYRRFFWLLSQKKGI